MADPSFDIVTLLVYFFYGLAFFSLGLALLLESGRFPTIFKSQLTAPLAAFGILHGIHEWLESYVLQHVSDGLQLPSWVIWIRLMILGLSFFFLLAYGLLSFLVISKHSSRRNIAALTLWGIYCLAIILCLLFTYRNGTSLLVNILDVMVRYLIAVPAAIFAALGLWLEANAPQGKEEKNLRPFLIWAALGFFLYGLSQFAVPELDMIPARLINSTSFRSMTGIPIQALRAVFALLITFNLLRAIQFVEKDRQLQFNAAQQAKVSALEAIKQEMAKREVMRQELLKHTIQAQEDERARIAHELHDETSQLLTAFSLDLATLKTIICDRLEVKDLVDRLQANSRDISQSLYRLVHDLRPAQLDDLGLLPALDFLKDSFALAGVNVHLNSLGNPRRLDKAVETSVFRVAQEALRNVLRHAQTDKANLTIWFNPQEVILEIADRGKGFSSSQTFLPPRGWGLAGMKERVESIGGEITINSNIGQGTTVRIEIPVFDVIP